MLLNEISVKELEQTYKDETNMRVKQRLHILLLLKEKHTQREIAKMLYIANGKVPFWKKRFESEGLSGLQDKPGRGKKSKLKEEELSMLMSAIEEGIQMPDGYRRGWKTKDVTQFVREQFGLDYTPRHCQRILNLIGCSLQVPRPRNKRRNQEAVNEFKREFKKNERFWAAAQLS